MFSNSESELRADVRGRSAAVKRDIQCACDAAFLRLRDKERQLLRVVDLVSSRQQGDLWAASLLRQQQEQQQGGSSRPPPSPAVQTMSLSLDTELLTRAIQQFATVKLDGVMTSSAAVTSSSLPDGLEEYGAEEHLVSHKPLPGSTGSVRVTRPPSLAGYSQFYPNRHLSCGSSLTSSDEDDKFEMIDSMIPEKIFRSDPIDIGKDRCGCPPRPALDIESLHLMDCVSPAAASQTADRDEETDGGPGEKLTAEVAHPLADCRQAWLLPAAGPGDHSSTVPSPFAQWQAVMSSSALYTPASTTSSTPAPAAASVAERQRWLLRQTCRANEPCQTPADCVSDCAERAQKMALDDWRSEWLLGGGGCGGGSFSGSFGDSGGSFGSFGGGSVDSGNNGSSGVFGGVGVGDFSAVIEEEDMQEAQTGQAAVPDLLAPFKQMENNTSWVVARG